MVSPFKFVLKYLFHISVGANLNAQIGLTNPATCGGDVCHMNLHKTFAMYVGTSSDCYILLTPCFKVPTEEVDPAWGNPVSDNKYFQAENTLQTDLCC